MRLPKLAIAVALPALVLAAPGVAGAEEQAPPPGNSAIEQYFETLPAPGGGRSTDTGRKRSPSKVLGKRNAQRLENFGPDGQAAAEVAAATAPAGAVVVSETVVEEPRGGVGGGSDEVGGAGAGEEGGGGPTGTEPSTSALAQIAKQATGADTGGGIGWLLPLIVALAAIGGIAFAAGRRRGARS